MVNSNVLLKKINLTRRKSWISCGCFRPLVQYHEWYDVRCLQLFAYRRLIKSNWITYIECRLRNGFFLSRIDEFELTVLSFRFSSQNIPSFLCYWIFFNCKSHKNMFFVKVFMQIVLMFQSRHTDTEFLLILVHKSKWFLLSKLCEWCSYHFSFIWSHSRTVWFCVILCACL